MRPKFRLLLYLLLLLNSCQIFNDPQNVLIEEYPNEQGTKKVVIFLRTGNAATNNSIHISILDQDYHLKDTDTGNIFVADNPAWNEEIAKTLFTINWIEEKVVVITSANWGRIFRQVEKLDAKGGPIIIQFELQK